MTEPDYPLSIPTPDEADRECFEKLKRELQSLLLNEN